MQFTINHQPYWLQCDEGQWYWTSATDESVNTFPAACEAQQDAIDYVDAVTADLFEQLAESLEDEIYGSYETQVNRLYHSTRL